MEIQEALTSFDWKFHEVEVLRIQPCCIVSGRPVCIVRFRVSPLLSPAFEFNHPFYRSSGKNSGLPDVWLPFRGIDSHAKWFNKGCRPPLDFKPVWESISSRKPNGRYGHPIYKIVSEFLADNDGFVDELPIEENFGKASLTCPVMDVTSGGPGVRR